MPYLHSARVAAVDSHGILLLCNDSFLCRVHVITPSIIRQLFCRPSGLRMPRTWSVVSAASSGICSSKDVAAAAAGGGGSLGNGSCSFVGDVPFEGRERADEELLPGWARRSEGFRYKSAVCEGDGGPGDACSPPLPPTPGSYHFPQFRAEISPDKVDVITSHVTLTICLTQPFASQWFTPEGQLIAADRRSRPFAFSSSSPSFTHSMQRHPNDQFFGLGDKTGPLDLHGRRLRVAMRDALGFDPEKGDPLYKHWPLLLVRDGSGSGACYGLLYDNMGGAAFDLGCEHSNYYGSYRSFEAEDGDLDFYFVMGPRLADVTARSVQLMGGSVLMPRWALGFHCTAMPLADAADAQEQMERFIRTSQEKEVPCSAFHLGSGYTSIDGKRYVFHWNHDKIAEPSTLIQHFKAAGMQVVANVKPCLLTDHPMFDEVQQVGGFVTAGGGGQVALSQFWDGMGAHLDFTNEAAVAWWRRGLQESLLSHGVAAAWNDNNEYELWEESATCSNFGRGSLPLSLLRPLHPLLMTRASVEQQLQSAPHLRPFSVSRAAMPGMQRYASTWSGDNRTDWKNLKWNLRMGLQMSISGMFFIGHDVGGFSGPPPEPELLVRWVQAGLLHPRFIMNSWKSDSTVTTPWMHPSMLPIIRWSIRLRYRLMPYLYSLMHHSVASHVPILRPTFFEFPHDPCCWQESDDFMLGPFLLAAPIVERRARERRVYLPAGPAGWFDFYTEEFFKGGQTVTVEARLDRVPLFVAAGAIIPMTDAWMDFSRSHDEGSRCIRIFPVPAGHAATQAENAADLALLGETKVPAKGASSFVCIEDDGVSREGAMSAVQFSLEAEEGQVRLAVKIEGGFELPFEVLGVSVPEMETRELVLSCSHCGEQGAEKNGGEIGKHVQMVKGNFTFHAA